MFPALTRPVVEALNVVLHNNYTILVKCLSWALVFRLTFRLSQHRLIDHGGSLARLARIFAL